MSGKPKIFVIVRCRYGNEPVGGALAEDGTALGGHFSSTDDFLRHDMGLTGNWKHDRYTAHYPDGWQLVDLIDCADLSTVPEYMAALEKNKALAQAEGSPPPGREP